METRVGIHAAHSAHVDCVDGDNLDLIVVDHDELGGRSDAVCRESNDVFAVGREQRRTERRQERSPLGAGFDAERVQHHVVEHCRRRVAAAELVEHDRNGGVGLGREHLRPTQRGQPIVGIVAIAGRGRVARCARSRRVGRARQGPSAVITQVEEPAGDDVALHLGGAAVDRGGP